MVMCCQILDKKSFKNSSFSNTILHLLDIFNLKLLEALHLLFSEVTGYVYIQYLYLNAIRLKSNPALWTKEIAVTFYTTNLVTEEFGPVYKIVVNSHPQDLVCA